MSKRRNKNPVVMDEVEVSEASPRRWPLRATENLTVLTVLGIMAKDGITWLELLALFTVLGTVIWRGRLAERRHRGESTGPRPKAEDR